ncbi:MAG TPA: class I lanthipeptide [Frankiaceae bacterium]|nr:class I lanthipeptide [Frankiaceae bacterium]
MKLVLKKDTLAELTTDELALVNGAAPLPWTPSCPLIMKLTERFSDVAC